MPDGNLTVQAQTVDVIEYPQFILIVGHPEPIHWGESAVRAFGCHVAPHLCRPGSTHVGWEIIEIAADNAG